MKFLRTISLVEQSRRSFSIDPIDWNNLEQSAKKNNFDSRNKLIQHLVKLHLTGTEESQELTIEQRQEVAKLNLLLEKIKIAKQDFRIKEMFADYVAIYIETFKKFPTQQGFRALMSKTETTLKPISKISNEQYRPKFAITESCGLHMGFCKICNDSDFSALKESILITRLEDHIKDEHHEDPYERIVN